MNNHSAYISIINAGGYKLNFWLGENVIIKDLDIKGFISAVLFDNLEYVKPKYCVDYWLDGLKQSVYLFDFEISKEK